MSIGDRIMVLRSHMEHNEWMKLANLVICLYKVAGIDSSSQQYLFLDDVLTAAERRFIK